jgi:SAM-dependent methyltransferase
LKTKDKKKSRKIKSRKNKKKRLTARTADKYELYQWSVQSPQEDIKFVSNIYRQIRKKKARHFREDFCGTGLLSATWIGRGSKYTAEGFDIDPEPVEWGKARHFADLGEAAERMTFHLADVRQASDVPPDIRCAQNFSYWVFKTRPEMLDYFSRAREDMAEGGIFVIDLYGGPEIFEEMEEEAEIKQGFTYVWHQDEYWPITGEALLHIHFKFPHGKKMKQAFSYDWRIWGLGELSDILDDAGFARVDCYWEGTDEDGVSGDGVFTRENKGERCLSYVAYLVAQK